MIDDGLYQKLPIYILVLSIFFLSSRVAINYVKFGEGVDLFFFCFYWLYFKGIQNKHIQVVNKICSNYRCDILLQLIT